MTRVFIGSSSESLLIAKAIKFNLEEENIGEIRLWSEIFEPSKYTLDQILGFTKEYDFGIFIWSDEDRLVSRKQNYLSPRDNVVLETGIFLGALGREKVFIIMPRDSQVKIPSDLLGLGVLFYSIPSDGNYRSSLSSSTIRIAEVIRRHQINSKLKQKVESSLKYFSEEYYNLEEARYEIQKELKEANDIKILSNKGRTIFGTSSSIINPNENEEFKNLRKIQILLLSPESRWINRGFIALRKYESIEDVKNELTATSRVIELALRKFTYGKKLSRNTGIKYFTGEPHFKIIMTEKNVYISTYSERKSNQVPLFKFKNEKGSMYGAIRRYFHDVWKNQSVYGESLKNKIEHQIFVGGVIVKKFQDQHYIGLVLREDGSWILPKGRKYIDDFSYEVAAIREVAEEVGIPESEIIIEKKLKEYSYEEHPDFHQNCQTVQFFLMTTVSKELVSLKTDEDHLMAKWWNLSESLPFMFYNYQKIILSEIIESEFSIQINFFDERPS